MPKVKLDMYNYSFVYLGNKIIRIDLRFHGRNPAELSDVASELTASDGHIYLDGHNFDFQGELKSHYNSATDVTRLAILVEEF